MPQPWLASLEGVEAQEDMTEHAAIAASEKTRTLEPKPAGEEEFEYTGNSKSWWSCV